MLADMVTVDGTDVPVPVAHLARDPLDPKFNRDGVVTVLRRKHSEIKRQLLDQTVVSGIGNIYADEALWRAKVNGARIASSLSRGARRRRRGDGRGAGTRWHVVRLALCQCQRRVRLLRSVTGRLWPRRGAVPALRRGDAPREVHEPLVVLLPEMPAPPPRAPALTPASEGVCTPTRRIWVAFCGRSREKGKGRKRAMTELWVERTGVRRYTGHSSRGAQVLVGNEDVEGVFTPGELMKIALAACSGMSCDQPIRRRLGDDYAATIKVSGPADREQERYPLLEETLSLDLSGLSEGEVTRLLTVVQRAVDQVCTVGRTLKSGTKVTFEVVDEPIARRVTGEDVGRT